MSQVLDIPKEYVPSLVLDNTTKFISEKYGVDLSKEQPDYRLSTGNSKLAADGIASFNLIPILHCPLAGECKKYCYATVGMQAFRNGVLRRARAFLATLATDFVSRMVREISKSKAQTIRIHDSGDFYSAEYLQKWVAIAQATPDKQYYAYTKMIPLVVAMADKLPANLKLIQSLGGIADKRINLELPHARIFETLTELIAAGYTDCSESDKPASMPGISRIGLVIHGQKSGKFTAAYTSK